MVHPNIKTSDKQKFQFYNQQLAFIFAKKTYNSSGFIILHIQGPVLLYPGTSTFIAGTITLVSGTRFFSSRPLLSENTGLDTKVLVLDTKVLVSGYKSTGPWICRIIVPELLPEEL